MISWYYDHMGNTSASVGGYALWAGKSGYWSVAINGTQIARGKELSLLRAEEAAEQWQSEHAAGENPVSPLSWRGDDAD